MAVNAAGHYYAAHGRGLRGARWALAAAERALPALALRAAVRLFCTPLPPRPRRAPPAPAGWKRTRLPFENGGLALLEGVQDATAPAPRGAALLVHGWGGHAGQLRRLGEALAADGWAVRILELPAHGAAAGRTSHLPQFTRAIDYVLARHAADGGAPPLLLAHSLGATAAARAVARGAAVRALVLVAPAASPQGYTRLFAHSFGLSERLRAALQARIESQQGMLMRDFEPAAVGPRVGVPTLVLHDRGDRVNPPADGAAFAAAIAGSRLVATDGLGHRKLLDDPDVAAAIAAFAAGC